MECAYRSGRCSVHPPIRQSGDLTTKFESIAVRYQDGYKPPTHKGKLYYTILLYKYLPVSYVYV